MKTADQWKRNWYGDSSNVPDDKELVKWIEGVMLDSYRAGMEAAARMCASAEDSYGAYYCAEMIEAAAKTAQLPTI